MTATIEWLLEELDGDEIVDVQHPENYAQALSWMEPDKDYRVGLVKDRQDGRSWAYVEDGAIVSNFTDAYGEDTGMVPAKYARETAQ